MKRSDSLKGLLPALLAFQGEVRGVEKNSTNPHFGSGYANLDSVLEASRELLVKNGLVITQAGEMREGKPVLLTVLLHAPSGEWIESELPIVNEKNTAQSAGSGISYARRYAQLAILNLSQLDDDGNAASERSAPKPKPAQAAPTPRPAQGATKPKTAEEIQLSQTPISEAQRKLLFATARNHGWHEANIKDLIWAEFQKDSTKKLTWPELQKTLKHMQANPKAEGAKA